MEHEYIGLQGILALIGGEQKRRGNEYICRCPSHSDKEPSLWVKEGEKGIILKCRAEKCTTEDICGALGIKMSQLFRDPPPNTGAARRTTRAAARPAAPAPAKADTPKLFNSYAEAYGRTGKLVKVYPYTDGSGQLLFEVARIQQPDGEKTFRQHRPADPKRGKFPIICKVPPEIRDGALYRLPEVEAAIRDGKPVYVVEGEKDADTMAAWGLCATTCSGGGKKWKPSHSDRLEGADVIILPDNDSTGEEHGQMVADSVLDKARSVRLIRLKDGYTGLKEKGDITDLAEQIGAERARALLLKMVETTSPIEKDLYKTACSVYNAMPGYCVENGCICQMTENGPKMLSTFVALPVKQLTRDDGVDVTMSVEVAGWTAGGRPLPRLNVDMEKFSGMAWAPGKWGLAANISSGNTVKDRLRFVITAAGAAVAKQSTIYAHSGWRKISGKWCYMYEGGCIGADGVTVKMDNSMGTYSLDAPDDITPEDAALRSFSLTTIIKETISVPLLGLMYLAPLREFLEQGGISPAFPIMVHGGTGTHKSTGVALFLSHFGDFRYDRLPANFHGTTNAIRRMGFVLKDMPLVVDDYHPTASLQERRKMEAIAQTISRMYGDNADRMRMDADLSLRSAQPPRGICITTAEELPDIGDSGVNRFYVVNVEKGDIPFTQDFSDMQAAAREGVLRAAMRNYIKWLLPQADKLGTGLRKIYYGYLERAREVLKSAEAHDRAAPMVAHIMIGLTSAMRYFENLGLIDREGAEALLESYWQIVADCSVQQAEKNKSESPLKMYTNAISEMLATKALQVADITPGSEYKEPQHGMVGYKDAQNYYFLAGTLYGAVVQFYSDQNRVFSSSQPEIHRMLLEQGYIAQTGSDGKTTRNKRIGGKNMRLLWIPRWRVDGTEPPKPPEPTVHQQSMAEFTEVDDTDLPEEFK